MAESRHDDQQDEQSENQASKDIEGAANQPNMHNKRLGRLGEDVAARYLASRGYEIIARNWTCQAGEADIIARDDDILVFAKGEDAIEYRERLSQRSRRQQKAWEVSQDR